MGKRGRVKRVVLRGLGASPGVALGPAWHHVSLELAVSPERVPPPAVPAEIRHFRASLRAAHAEIGHLLRRLGTGGDDPANRIMASHQMILQDRELAREIVAAIKTERMNAPHAVRSVLRAKAHYLESLPSELFRARAADIRDVERRILGHLLGGSAPAAAQLPSQAVVVAAEVVPSDAVALAPARVGAFVTERGTSASHVTILARSRGVPAVVGVAHALATVPDGQATLVDGDRGLVIVAPNRRDLAELHAARERQSRMAALYRGSGREVGRTLDGKAVAVLANIERPEDARAAQEAGAEGVGLYRTEFFFMGAGKFPDQEEQQQAYAVVVNVFGNAPVTIRTLDLGGDKHAALMGSAPEANPYLGLRGIRFGLVHEEVFLSQARALLLAGSSGCVRIMLPMISQVGELRAARRLIEQAATELRAAGQPVAEQISLGVMIEVPAAVMMSSALAREADFFSIGSNDLIQYTLAVDRGNARVAHLYNALDPAVLRAIDMTVRAAHTGGIRVGSCGEMSGDVLGLMLLVGLGVDELSVAPGLVPRAKALLRQIRAADMEDLARRCLAADSAADVTREIREALRGYPQFAIIELDGRTECSWQPEDAAPQ